MQTIAKISLDLYNKNIVKVSAKQYDTGRGIEVTCTHNGIIYDVDTNTTSAFVRFKKPDGFNVFNQCEIVNNRIMIELTQQMLVVPGKCDVDVMIMRKVYSLGEKSIDDIIQLDAPIVSTMNFTLNIEPIPIDYDDIESSYEFDALTEALAHLDKQDKIIKDFQDDLKNHKFVLTDDKNVANGIAPLDINKKILSENINFGTTTGTVFEGSRGKTVESNLDAHVTNRSNPHSVTKSQVGLGNVDNTSDANKSVKYATSAGSTTTATKATQDSAGQQINTTYIKSLSVSGKVITYAKGDGTTGTITTQDTNTTNTTGSTNTSSKIFLVGATSQAASPVTYSHDTAYVGTDGCLYSNSTRVVSEVTQSTEPTIQKTGDYWIIEG
jgi:bacteriophage-related protein